MNIIENLLPNLSGKKKSRMPKRYPKKYELTAPFISELLLQIQSWSRLQFCRNFALLVSGLYSKFVRFKDLYLQTNSVEHEVKFDSAPALHKKSGFSVLRANR
jgi:hypothetical protein